MMNWITDGELRYFKGNALFWTEILSIQKELFNLEIRVVGLYHIFICLWEIIENKTSPNWQCFLHGNLHPIPSKTGILVTNERSSWPYLLTSTVPSIYSSYCERRQLSLYRNKSQSKNCDYGYRFIYQNKSSYTRFPICFWYSVKVLSDKHPSYSNPSSFNEPAVSIKFD